MPPLIPPPHSQFVAHRDCGLSSACDDGIRWRKCVKDHGFIEQAALLEVLDQRRGTIMPMASGP